MGQRVLYTIIRPIPIFKVPKNVQRNKNKNNKDAHESRTIRRGRGGNDGFVAKKE